MLYATSVDVSVPNGPGVNELQFILSASRVLGGQSKFILPEPSRELPDNFPTDNVIYLPPLRRSSPFSWLRHEVRKIRALRTATLHANTSYVVMRTGVLPIAEFLARSRLPTYFIKTAGSGKFEVFDRKAHWRLLKPVQRWIFGRLLKYSAGADVVTDIHRKSLESIFPEIQGRVTVFDNAVDTMMFAPKDSTALKKSLSLDRFKYLVGYIGNFADTRGAIEMLQSWSHMEQANDTGLVVVSGDGRGRSEVTELAEEMGISDRVFFLGPVSMSEVSAYMSMLDIGVSFREDDGCSELKVRQYLACGVPVLVSAGVNAFVNEADLGAMMPRDNPQAIGAAASDILAGRRCADRTKIREFAVQNLGFDAMIRLRCGHWRTLTETAGKD